MFDVPTFIHENNSTRKINFKFFITPKYRNLVT
jgi:hypothetical protein